MNGTDIQLTVIKNPFKALDREVLTVSADYTFAQLYANLGLHYPISYVMFIDGDELVADIHSKPKNEHVYIKIMPSGSNRSMGTVGKIAGAALIVAGAVLSAYGLSVVGVPLIGMGVGLVLGGVALYNTNIPKIGAANLDGSETRYSVSGTENTARAGGRVPVLLGRHLIVPDLIAAPQVSLTTDGDQQILQGFCGGYGDIRVESDSYKLGDTPLTSDYFTFNLGESFAASYPDYLPEWCKTATISAELDGTVTNETDPNFNATEIVRTTPSNIYRFTVFITCPSGLGKYDKNGNLQENAVNVKIQYRTNENGVVGAWKNYPNPGYFLYDKPIYDPNWVGSQGNTTPPIIGYEPVYTEPNTGIVRVSGKSSTTLRFQFPLDLANENSGQADYTASRRYDIRVLRASDYDSATSTIGRVYLDMIRYDVAFWNPTKVTRPYKYPYVNGSQVALLVHGLKVLASENANGTVRNFNYVGQTYINVYSGSGSGASSWTGKALTSNPAALFLYVLRTNYINNHAATDSQIDWPAFETWYTYCNTKDFECNYHASGDFKVSDLLDVIAHAGRASWSIIDAKFTIVIDDVRPNVVQAFTPRNTWNFSGQKLFVDRPTGLRMKFVDETINFQQAERIVYFDDDNPDDTLIQEVNVTGVTNPSQIYKMAKYQLACTYLRPEIFSFEVDAEQLACLRGDRVKLNHDVPLIGLTSGRINGLFQGSGNDVAINVDENCIFEPAKTYSVQIRKSDGTTITKALTNPATVGNVETVVLTFATPFTSGEIEEGNLFMFGESGEESLDLLVMDIEPGSDLTAKLTCVPYSPDVYNADSGTIPDYDPVVSLPADIVNTIKLGIPLDTEQLAADSVSSIVETDIRSIAMTATTPSGDVLNINSPFLGDIHHPKIMESQFESFKLNSVDSIKYYEDGIVVSSCFENTINPMHGFRVSESSYYQDIQNFGIYGVCPQSPFYAICSGVIYVTATMQIIWNIDGKTTIINDSLPFAAVIDGFLFYVSSVDGGLYSVFPSGVRNPENKNIVSGYSNSISMCLSSSENKIYFIDNNGNLTSNSIQSSIIGQNTTNKYSEYCRMIDGFNKDCNILNSRDIISGAVIGKNLSSIYYETGTIISDAVYGSYGLELTLTGNKKTAEEIIEVGSTSDSGAYSNKITETGMFTFSSGIISGFTNSIDGATNIYLKISGGTANDGYYRADLQNIGDKYLSIAASGKTFTPGSYLCTVEYRHGAIINDVEVLSHLSGIITLTSAVDNYWSSVTAGVTLVDIPFKKIVDGDEYFYSGRLYFNNSSRTEIQSDNASSRNIYIFPIWKKSINGAEYTVKIGDIVTVENDKTFSLTQSNEILTGSVVENIHQIKYVGNDTLLYSTSDMEIYRVTDESSATPQLFDGGALYFDANETDIIIQENDTGSIYFASTQQELAKADEKPYIQATSLTQNFQALLVSGSNKIIVYSDSWVSKIDAGTFIGGTGIPSGTFVINKRGNEVYLSENVTSSGEKTLSIVSTSRKYYEPNDIIRDGARYGTRKYAGQVNYLAMPIPETGMGFFTCKEYTTGANSTDTTKIATGIFNYVDNTNYSLSVLSGTSANFTAQIIDGKMNIVFDKTGGGYANQDPEITIMRLS